ncbi:MAG: endonuclease [Magnetococcales bacterium]|nr:endonuclease [Magnetococcales bacterium]
MKPDPQKLFKVLYGAYGPQHWWPAKSMEAMMVGVILVQNTAWTQAAKVVDSLDANNCLSWQALRDIDDETLWQWLRPAGYFRVKSRRIKALAHFMASYSDSVTELFTLETADLRNQLLKVNGVGKESADSIICYGAGRHVFVVDTYTRRLFTRLGWVDEKIGYDELQHLVHSNIVKAKKPGGIEIFNEFHALIVRHAKEHCHKRPSCNKCPVKFCLKVGI